MKENGIVGKKAVYIALGVNQEGKKDILSMYIGTNESAKTWLSLFNDPKNRGVKYILVMCADGLTGIKEAIEAAFPKNRIPKMYSAYDKKYNKVCSDKRL